MNSEQKKLLLALVLALLATIVINSFYAGLAVMVLYFLSLRKQSATQTQEAEQQPHTAETDSVQFEDPIGKAPWYWALLWLRTSALEYVWTAKFVADQGGLREIYSRWASSLPGDHTGGETFLPWTGVATVKTGGIGFGFNLLGLSYYPFEWPRVGFIEVVSQSDKVPNLVWFVSNPREVAAYISSQMQSRATTQQATAQHATAH